VSYTRRCRKNSGFGDNDHFLVREASGRLLERSQLLGPTGGTFMPSPRNTLLSGEQTLNRVLNLLDQRKQQLCEIIDSEQTTPEEKYEALMRFASLTGTLADIAKVE